MSRPLPSGDPTQLGPFRLTARLMETSAGIVYLGEDEQGRQASVALLTRGAAQDAAARDRFRAAILAAVPGAGRPPRGRAGGRGPGDPAPVVAAQPEGPAPWVATLYEPEGSGSGSGSGMGAERFLDPVMLRGFYERPGPDQSRQAEQAGVRHGPNFRPYWSGGGPAVGAPPRPVLPGPPGVPRQRSDRGLVAAILSLAAMLGLLAVLMLVVFGCQPEAVAPPPDPPSDTYTPPTPPPSSPGQGPTPTPSPVPSGESGQPEI